MTTILRKNDPIPQPPALASFSEITDRVTEILRGVRSLGDEALFTYNERFDGFPGRDLRVPAEAFDEAREKVDPAFLEILEEASENIRAYHDRQHFQDFDYTTAEGARIGQRTLPLDAVGLYVPGGKATYPSTVLMNVIPAQCAGVNRIAVVTPPDADGRINPHVLTTLDFLGIREVYRVGGAQAIAALAFGTDQIPRVDKIVGPGNAYVAEAKRQVFGVVAIDSIAGPSEILVLADDSADPLFIAQDLLSQAEHDEEARCFLLSTETDLFEAVDRRLRDRIQASPRRGILEAVYENGLFYLQRDTMEELYEVANLLAPEHLEIMVRDEERAFSALRHFGSLFIGPFSPEPVGDYFAGPNHTLPTSGTARFFSPLSTYDFYKRQSYLAYSEEALRKKGEKIAAFAALEGLVEHKRSVEVRLK